MSNMQIALLSLTSLLAATVQAQSAPQFEVVVQENLPVAYQASDTKVTPGLLVPRNDTLEAPAVSLPSGAPDNETYMVFMIDQDVPRNGSTFTLLHWFRPDLHRSMDNDTLTLLMIDDNTPSIEGADYIPPTPPGGSGPHRYTFLLYPQPPNFTIPEAYADINPPADSAARIGFNLTAFASAAGLADPVAANYLRVLNGTEAETASAESATGTVGVAPTESPTTVASTTDSEAAASATASEDSPTATMSGTTTPSQSTTGDVNPPTESDSGGNVNVAAPYVGLALAVVGAGMWMA